MRYLTLATDADGIATLTLNRPDKHNALNEDVIAELTAASTQIANDPSICAVVLTGSGKSFCAGADLNWMQRQFDASRAERMEQALALATMLDSLNTLPKPLIGRINGSAYGGGLGLIAVCDVAIADASARFSFTETRLGIIPATISPFVLARMGEAAARQVFFSARAFTADEAVRLGLLSASVSADKFDAAIAAEAAPYLATDPDAVARSKALALSFGSTIGAANIQRTAEALADAWESPEARRRIGAFLAKSRKQA